MHMSKLIKMFTLNVQFFVHQFYLNKIILKKDWGYISKCQQHDLFLDKL